MLSCSQGFHVVTRGVGNGSDIGQTVVSAWREDCNQFMHQKSFQQSGEEDQSDGSTRCRRRPVPKWTISQHDFEYGDRRRLSITTRQFPSESHLLVPIFEFSCTETWHRPRWTIETSRHQPGINHLVSYIEQFKVS